MQLKSIVWTGCLLGVACTAERNAAPQSQPAARANAEAPRDPWSAPPLERALSVRDGRTGERLELDQLFDRLAAADVVFLGETHIDETTHATELATFEALLARRPGKVVLAMEMFERDVQATLEAYLSGAIDETTFLSKARPWSNYATSYRPLIERAKLAHAPVVASNFPAPLRMRLAGDDELLAKLSSDERRNAPEKLLAETPLYWRRVDNAIRGHIGMMGPRPAADDPRLTDTQSLWDNCMGESCARALDAHPGAMVVHVNGGFHSEYWDGTARQLALRKPDAKILTVAIEPTTNPSVEELAGIPRADFVVFAESRAKDVDEGSYAVAISRELKYRLHVPARATREHPVPLLVWLGDDGETAGDSLAEWRERIGESCAIAAIEAPYREIQDDLVEGGRWYWPDSFSEDIGALAEGIDRTVGYLARRLPIDGSRVCLAGEGTGATVASSVALLADGLSVRALALEPRRFAKIKDFALPLPELRGDAPKAAKSLRLVVGSNDREWWQSEIDAYNGVGFASELTAPESDLWRADLARENAVRERLGLEPWTVEANAAHKFVIASNARGREFARRIAMRHLHTERELVAVVAAAPTEPGASEIATAVQAADFAGGRALPRCPGAFGGTTVIVLAADAPQTEVDAWLALEKDDPLAKSSRFHRLRVATATGERELPKVLAELAAKNRKNVMIVPAAFCADGATLRALQASVRDAEDRMTIVWRAGLGGFDR